MSALHPRDETELNDCISELLARALPPSELRRRAPLAIARAAAEVLNPGRPAHRAFLEAGEKIGISSAMTREALGNYMPLLTEQGLLDMQAREFRIGPDQDLLTPRLIFHVLAGNLFLSGLESINHGLLAGGPSLVRCSEGDQHFPVAWLSALAEADPETARSLQVAWWPRQQEALTSTACHAADVVIAFGNDESVAAVRQLTPIASRFIAHGTKVSFAVLTSEAIESEPEELAQRVAYDFSVYDQQGCLSPRALFVEKSDRVALERFSVALLEEMRLLLQRLPRAELTLPDRAALARERDEVLLEAAVRGNAQLLSRVGEELVVVRRTIHPFRLGCVNRFLDMRIFTSLEEVEQALAPYRRRIACLGTTLPQEQLRSLWNSVRPGRVCKPGTMQKPPLGWTHDGRLPLSDLAELVQLT